MRQRHRALIFVMFIILILSGCSDISKSRASGKLSVVTSFNAISEFARAVGGEKIEVYTVVPNGTEPHDFEPKARDLMNINDSDVFIYNGLGMEAWMNEVKNAISGSKSLMVDASTGCDLIKYNNSAGEDHQYDPHIWLSLKEAQIELKNIKDALIKADAKNSSYYNKNYDIYVNKLESLHNEFYTKINTLKNKNFVTGHAAFGYLCREFNLVQNSVEDVFAEGEPSAEALKNLVEYCRKNNIKTIFTESMVSPKISETLANEVNAKIQTIYTLESKEDNKDYLTAMTENLNNIYKSLKDSQ